MKESGPLQKAAWAAAGAALLGGGMLLGFASALLRRREVPEAKPEPAGPAGTPATGASQIRRVNELAQAVANLQKRLEAAAPSPMTVAEKLEDVSLRVERLEQRIEQLATEPAMPFLEKVLPAVDELVELKIGGLDKILKDQVHAIETLRDASAQTDALLQKLIHEVQALGEHPAEKQQPPNAESAGEGPKDYPVA